MSAATPPLILFEAAGIEAFGPPVALRPVWELRLGARTLAERCAAIWPAGALYYWPRPRLRGLCPEAPAAVFAAPRVLLLAGNQMMTAPEAASLLAGLGPGESLRAGEREVALCLSGAEAREWLGALADGAAVWPAPAAEPRESALGPLVDYWWELYALAPRAMADDQISLLAAGDWQRCAASGGGECYLAPGAELGPGAVIDAGAGPVLLDRDVKVGALSVVAGPCYLGPGTRTKPHTQLHGVFAGPQCRLGGEVEETQLQGYANKQHHGFLGHAVVGEWVNLGAGATNSDLKNNYSGVRVEQGGRRLESQQRFLGSCLGDHVKIGIQARLSTGTVLEPFTNWFGGDFPPKGLPPFSWGGDGLLVEHALDKALATAAIAMGRRGVELSPAAAAVAQSLFAASAPWRRERLG